MSVGFRDSESCDDIEAKIAVVMTTKVSLRYCM